MLNTNHNLLFKGTILALCIISFVHIFLFPIYSTETTVTKTYVDFEQSLCTSNIDKKRRPNLQKKIHCPSPSYGIVTIMQGGRLGNQMWEYASVWALARRTGLEPYVPRCIRRKLEMVFEALTVPTFDEIADCPFAIGRFVRSLDEWNCTNQSIVLPRYSFQPDLVLDWRQDIVDEFRIRRTLLEKSATILKKLSGNLTDVIYIGVHVRRTDYIGYLLRKYSKTPAPLSFYLRAMRYFDIKFRKKNVIYVVASDDPAWCKRSFAARKNVHVVGGKNQPALDMAILASCNHTIIDYGTFGQWAAILAGGETVYYNLTNHSSVKVAQVLDDWHTV